MKKLNGKSYAWFLFTLSAIQFVHIVDFMIMMPLGDTLMDSFDINPQQFSLLVSAYTFSAGIVGFTAAFFIDKYDRKKALFFLFTGVTIGTLACAVSWSYEMLLIARIIAGGFGGITSALILALIGDAVPLEKRASAMGILMSAFSAASVFGVPLGYYLAEISTWKAPFLLLGGLGFLIVVLILRCVPSLTTHLESKDREKKMEILTNIAKDKNRQNALWFSVFLTLGHFAIIPFIAPYMERNVGFEGKEITLIYLIGGAFTFFSAPIIGKLADRKGHTKIYTVFALLTLIPIFLMTNMPSVHIAWALAATTLFFITSTGRYAPAQTLITSAIKPENRGSFMSINSALGQLSAGIAAMVGGFIIIEPEKGGMLENYEWVGYFAIVLSIVAIWMGRRVRSIS